MKFLIAPLNWGLGHATRSIPIIRHYLAKGDEVVLGGDGESILLLKQAFPDLRVIDLPSLELRYTSDPKQRGFYFRAVWALIRFTIADHYYLRKALAIEHFDLIISDNRFGLFSRQIRSVYITHQLYPILPKRLRFFQPLARIVHACIYKRYDEVWVPDYESTDNNLSGWLSHGRRFDKKVQYIGPLSRFTFPEGIPNLCRSDANYPIVAVLSGLEPQRTLFEQELVERFKESTIPVLIVRGKIGSPRSTTRIGAVTMIPYLSDKELLPLLMQAEKIIARSGYTSIMDLETLNLLAKAELHPTPGQSEQEYLATHLASRCK